MIFKYVTCQSFKREFISFFKIVAGKAVQTEHVILELPSFCDFALPVQLSFTNLHLECLRLKFGLHCLTHLFLQQFVCFSLEQLRFDQIAFPLFQPKLDLLTFFS